LKTSPIILTFHGFFILGVFPLAISSGAGAVARQTIGFYSDRGMLAGDLTLASSLCAVLLCGDTKIAYRPQDQLAELEANYELQVKHENQLNSIILFKNSNAPIKRTA